MEGRDTQSWWVLLDNQSTVDVFVNKKLLKNIRTVDGDMVIHSHGGSRTTNKVGDFPGYPNPVWFDPEGIANILSMSNMQKLYRITYDSAKEGAFIVHLKGKQLVFKMAKIGLYYVDMRNRSYMFNLTVNENKQMYTRRQMKGADAARKLQQVLQYPTTKQYKTIVESNAIKDCPVTLEDIKVAGRKLEDYFVTSGGGGRKPKRKSWHGRAKTKGTCLRI